MDKFIYPNNSMFGRKAIIILVLLAAIIFFAGAFYRVQPNPGEESVLVYKPVIFGHGGVDPVPFPPVLPGASSVRSIRSFPSCPLP